MDRPFFNRNVEDLQREFADRLDDLQFLELLAHELTFRSTVAAKGLQSETAARIADLRSRASSAPVGASKRSGEKPEREPGVISPLPPEKWPRNLLGAWLALEVLSPQTFRDVEDLVEGDARRIADLSRRPLPWERGERSRENNRLYYQVLLGCIRMDVATNALLQRYADASPEFTSQSGFCPIAVVVLDQQGRLVPDRSVSVASFAWGWRIAMEGRLADLSQWSSVEQALRAEIADQLKRKGENDEILPLDSQAIRSAFDFTCMKLRIDPGVVVEPQYVVRTYQWFTVKSPPEPIILNSFFLEDLAWSMQRVDRHSAPLRQFLSVARKEHSLDLLTSPRDMEAAVRPSQYPPARWPAHGRHPLVLMQQAAVNLAVHELAAKEALFAVNGPPGTGKTTLLRDICAALVTQRAQRLAAFDDPSSAFAETGVALTASGTKTSLHSVDDKIRGFEIVVASTNNRAVENVSRELPGLTAVASDAEDLRYLSSISDHLNGEDGSTWGLFAAVLGNQANVAAFKKTLRDEDRGLLAYLAACSGFLTVVPGQSSGADASAVPRPPDVVLRERPPSNRQDALRRWQLARSVFHVAAEEVRKAIARAEQLREQCLELDRREIELGQRQSDLQEKRKEFDDLAMAHQLASTRSDDLLKRLPAAEEARRAHDAFRPAWWRRLLLLEDARAWSKKYNVHKDRVRKLKAELKLANTVLADSKRKWSIVKTQQELAEKVAEAAQSAFDELKALIEEAAVREGIGVLSPNMIAAATDDQQAARIQKLSPWFGEKAQRARDDLFVAAMHLQRAFIDAAARPIRNNLAALFGMASLETKERMPLVPHLWSTLFLVVPVVSTTFASVRKLFRLLPEQSLGWLLIDEAGQAIPQAAVGALMRCRRALVVGDPLQIEPVTSLPSKLIQAVSDYYSVERKRWTAPTSSVQTLADAVNKYASTIEQVNGSKQIGLPLLVHRRCQAPMFDISNYVAYGGKMIQATPPADVRAHPVLGQSRWLDVRGASVAKWSEAEGRVVVRALSDLFEGSSAPPDVFIISPFRNVAYRLRDLVPRGVGTLDTDVSSRWWAERIGTIHTFQGKQADIVFLVLGASGPQEGGARAWAAGTPNIVNVAASRAKAFFYVVGDASAWRGIGAMKTVQAYLPVDDSAQAGVRRRGI